MRSADIRRLEGRLNNNLLKESFLRITSLCHVSIRNAESCKSHWHKNVAEGLPANGKTWDKNVDGMKKLNL
jgi:hypothetical protein